MTSSYTFLAALERMTPHLRQILGDKEWVAAQGEFNKQINQFKAAQSELEEMRSVIALQKLLSPYPSARKRLALEVMLQEAFGQVQTDMGRLLDAIQLDALFSVISPAFAWSDSTEDFQFRNITVTTDGDLKATSVKVRNVRFDPGQILEVAGSATLNVLGIIATPTPILIGLCSLLTLRALQKAMTIELSQNEASVFLGFIHTLKENPKATELAILTRVNKEREQFSLGPLTSAQFRELAERLEELGSISLNEGIWSITEEYEVQD